MDADLVRSQDPEGRDDLLGSVGVSRLSGHEVDERLEGDSALPVGIHQGHDAGKLSFTLRQECEETLTSTAHNSWLCPALGGELNRAKKKNWQVFHYM